LRNSLGPWHPRDRFLNKGDVEERNNFISALVGDLGRVNLGDINLVLLLNIFTNNELLEELIEFWTCGLFNLTTNAPNTGEHKRVHEDFLSVGRGALELFTTPLNAEEVEYVQEVVHQEVESGLYGELALKTGVL
jgi:hypothetical protein